MTSLLLVGVLTVSKVGLAQSGRAGGSQQWAKGSSARPGEVADSVYYGRMIAYQGRTSAADTEANTIGAMLGAIDRQPFAVHADVRMTADDRIILYASDSMEGLYIPDSPYELLAEHPAYRRDRVAQLKPYLTRGLEKLSRGSATTSLLLELHWSGRAEQDVRFADELADVVASFEGMSASGRIILTSSDFTLCERLRMRLPQVRIFYQGWEIAADKVRQAGMDGLYCDMKAYYKHPEVVEEWRAAGLTVAVQPVSNEVDEVKLMEMGIEYLATSDFKLLASLFKRVKR